MSKTAEHPRLTRKLAKPRVRRLKPRGHVGPIIDRDQLHQYFWERVDENNLVRVHQTALAEALGVSGRTISATMAHFCETGRALRVRFDQGGIGIYQIADPTTWRISREETWADGRTHRTIKWG